MSIKLDPDKHIYTLHGSEIPSVTQVIEGVGLYPKYSENPMYRRRGTAAHKACALLIYGRLNRKNTSPAILGYVESFEKFLVGSGFRPNIVEQLTWSEAWRVAGTVDLHGILGGDPTIIDLKTGEPPEATRIQTAGYSCLIKESHGLETSRRIALRLHGNGDTATPIEYSNIAEDSRHFYSIVSIWHLKKKFGL